MSAPTQRAVRFVVLTVLIDAMGFGIVLPVLPGIIMKLGHVGLADATRIGGWLGLAYAAVQFLTGPTMGNLGDRFGRRPVILGSLAGFAADYALMGFAPSLGWLFLGRALAGLFGASFGPAGAAMADLSAPEDRARHFGMIGGRSAWASWSDPRSAGYWGNSAHARRSMPRRSWPPPICCSG
jgi:DHA1 family tetracycline resistance protein-like MFS transporter